MACSGDKDQVLYEGEWFDRLVDDSHTVTLKHPQYGSDSERRPLGIQEITLGIAKRLKQRHTHS